MIATKSLDISYPVEEYRRIVEDDTEVYSKDHMAMLKQIGAEFDRL